MIAVPERMRHLPIDRRGYPVPAMLYRDESGTPHFTINDERRRQAIILGDLCSICGNKLFRGRWFIGGDRSAFDPHGAYLDPPTHEECAHYALRVCPYLAAPTYDKLIGDKTLPEGDPAEIAPKDPAHVPEIRPVVFVAVMAVGTEKIVDEIAVAIADLRLVRYVRPVKPYRKVEYWLHGEQLEQHVAHALLASRVTKP